MADLAWTRKYRPSSFDDYIGDDVKNKIMNRFKDPDNAPHTIMLYGTRGTGKTSMARLMCKELLCLEPVDGHSCGHCEMCEQINEYITSTEAGVECDGIVEVDAATTTGKSDINDIIDDLLIEPLYPLRFKVCILDECHQLSNAAQNSLLKVIEEPPAHLIFILCTTDPEKVLPTIHSRMQQKIEVRKKSVEEMAQKLLDISKKENLHTSMEALRVIAKKGDRVPRECINLLESVAKNNGNIVELDQVRATIGDVSTELYVDFFNAANTSLEAILLFNQKMKDTNVSYKDFMRNLSRFMLDCCYVKHGIALEDYSIEFVNQAKEIFKRYRSGEFDMALQIIDTASKSIDDDDIKSELTITLTAIRLGKVWLLSQGDLGNEASMAEQENAASITKYKKRLEEDDAKQFDKVKDFSATKEALGAIFTQMTEVRDSTGVIRSPGVLPPISASETSSKPNSDKADENKNDNYIPLEDLNKLLD